MLHASFRPRLAATPLRFANTSPPSGCVGDLHPQAVEHARHTTNRFAGVRVSPAHSKAAACCVVPPPIVSQAALVGWISRYFPGPGRPRRVVGSRSGRPPSRSPHRAAASWCVRERRNHLVRCPGIPRAGGRGLDIWGGPAGETTSSVMDRARPQPGRITCRSSVSGDPLGRLARRSHLCFQIPLAGPLPRFVLRGCIRKADGA